MRDGGRTGHPLEELYRRVQSLRSAEGSSGVLRINLVRGSLDLEWVRLDGSWPGRSCESIEFATLEWVDWFNNRRLLRPLANIPLAEAEARHHAMPEQSGMAA